jgi:hypothetical protein
LLEPGVEPGFLMVFADPVSSGSFFLSMMNFGRMLGFLARKLTASHSCSELRVACRAEVAVTVGEARRLRRVGREVGEVLAPRVGIHLSCRRVLATLPEGLASLEGVCRRLDRRIGKSQGGHGGQAAQCDCGGQVLHQRPLS